MNYDFEKTYDPTTRTLTLTLWIDRDNNKNEVVTHKNLSDAEVENMGALIENYKYHLIERYDYRA